MEPQLRKRRRALPVNPETEPQPSRGLGGACSAVIAIAPLHLHHQLPAHGLEHPARHERERGPGIDDCPAAAVDFGGQVPIWDLHAPPADADLPETKIIIDGVPRFRRVGETKIIIDGVHAQAVGEPSQPELTRERGTAAAESRDSGAEGSGVAAIAV
ncbi:unnamed protein product [Linum trigynum]|uniref:Uncharacterized protein n=1 Tax=Linum trigynum TaxID=586398 RepID=A0AAV2F7N5_9ROSI